MREIELGDIVRDTITGFEGVAVATTEWLNGCRRISIQPQKLHDGKPIESDWFDETQVAVVKKSRKRELAKTGGPRPDPRRRGNVA
jgi:hypothetical protein